MTCFTAVNYIGAFVGAQPLVLFLVSRRPSSGGDFETCLQIRPGSDDILKRPQPRPVSDQRLATNDQRLFFCTE
jgi:hypothetical protein